jgi:hypothetical protein
MSGALGKVKLSDLLDKILLESQGKDKITIQDMIDVLGVRAYGSLLILFALPNTIPSIPGLGAFLGAPLVFLAIQMMLGKEPWVPDFLGRQGVTFETVVRLRDKSRPFLLKADKIVRPRWLFLTSVTVERFLGFIILILSLCVLTPVPFTNLLPAWCVVIMAIGFLERDGFWVLSGFFLGLLAIGLVYGVMSVFVTALLSAFF